MRDDSSIRVEYMSVLRGGEQKWRYSSTFTVGEEAGDPLFEPEFATIEAATEAALAHAKELREYHKQVRMVFETHAYERRVVEMS